MNDPKVMFFYKKKNVFWTKICRVYIIKYIIIYIFIHIMTRFKIALDFIVSR